MEVSPASVEYARAGDSRRSCKSTPMSWAHALHATGETVLGAGTAAIHSEARGRRRFVDRREGLEGWAGLEVAAAIEARSVAARKRSSNCSRTAAAVFKSARASSKLCLKSSRSLAALPFDSGTHDKGYLS
jgi:hypothetical protein